jgi:hypothetical protein
MQPVNILTAIFKLPVSFDEVQPFRKSVTKLISHKRDFFQNKGIPTDLFHNHNEATGKTLNRYPLIQYKSIGGKAAITGIDSGAEALNLLIKDGRKNTLYIQAGDNKMLTFEILHTEKQRHRFSILKKDREYRLEKWLPMDDERFTAWEKAGTLKKRCSILDECLIQQISRLLSSVGFEKQEKIEANVTNIWYCYWQHEFRWSKLCFNISFSSNVDLPLEAGIGQVPSIGFGRILVNQSKNQI